MTFSFTSPIKKVCPQSPSGVNRLDFVMNSDAQTRNIDDFVGGKMSSSSLQLLSSVGHVVKNRSYPQHRPAKSSSVRCLVQMPLRCVTYMILPLASYLDHDSH